jgi:hypothetical protein
VRFCIDRRIVGSDRHLVVDHETMGCAWSDHVPVNVWHLSGVVKPQALCLDSMLRLRGTTIELMPGRRYERLMEQVAPVVAKARCVPWSKVMPPAEYAVFVKKLVNSAAVAIDPITLDYLSSAWAVGDRLLGSLVPAIVDPTRLRTLLMREKSDSNAAALRSFTPIGGTECARVEYERLATSTGRLTVASGPQILTVRKDCRNVLRPSRPGGCVCSIDFSSLEARIVLAEAGRTCVEPDLYGMIAQQVFAGVVARDQVKTATLSLLYGAGRRMVAECLGTDGPNVDAFIARISEYFMFDALGARLAAEWSEHGFVRNAFGRPLLLDGKEPTLSLLTSHFAQSTGVDVSLLGFNELMRMIGELARPLFVLHDALIVDVAPGAFEAVSGMNEVVVAGHRYPLRLDVISA